VELFREPDAHLGFILGPITMGQILSTPMILAGLVALVLALRRPAIKDA
jgi:phosphatidylglycerol:prolipoprotein diacylglycerol transferase